MDTSIQDKLEYLNDFLTTAGFDQKTIDDHFGRLAKIIFVNVMLSFDKITASDDKPFPKMKSMEDFYKYYESYIDRSTIDKVIQEQTQKTVSGYLKTICDNLPK